MLLQGFIGKNAKIRIFRSVWLHSISLAWLAHGSAQALEPIKMALSCSEPAKLTEIAQSCGLAILVVFIPYLCILAIKYDV